MPEGKAMTPSVTAMMIDDIGQLEASETVRFGVDGSAYEIALSARQASELRSMAGRYISVARRVRPARSPARHMSELRGAAPPGLRSERRGSERRGSERRGKAVPQGRPEASGKQQHQPRPRARVQTDPEQSRRIRSWAIERGLLDSPRGRISQHVVDEYEAAMRVATVPFRSPGTAEPEPEGTAAAEAEVRGGGHDLTDGEKQELRIIADAAKPERTVVAGRLRTKGLADRDSAGNWWLTDAGRRELKSA
jgi:Lsr2